jgi:TolB protein
MCLPGGLKCVVVFAALCMALAGCGPGGAAPTPMPALVPVAPRPTRAANAGPPPTVLAEGTPVPGRVLFAKDGDIWLWQGERGGALISSGSAYQPAWSPDGTRVAYVERVESASDVMVAPAEGGEPLRLTGNSSSSPPHSYERVYESRWAFYPAWSPDGGEIAFAGQGGPPFGSPANEYHMSLFVAPAGGEGGGQQLYADESGHIGRLAYAPGGGSIVFVYGPVDTDASRLYRFDRASGVVEPLPGAPETSYDPAFSADGRWLAFAARAEGGTDVFALPLAGGAPVRLTSLQGARAPAFSPDGKLLAFLALAPGSSSFDLWIADVQSGPDGALSASQPRQITHDMRIDADSGLSWAR